MRIYVCRDRSGNLFQASDELAEVLDHAAAARLASFNGAWSVRVDANVITEVRHATCGRWRVMSYPGGYSKAEWSEGWRITQDMPAEVEEALCFALGVSARRPWTAEEILAREG